PAAADETAAASAHQARTQPAAPNRATAVWLATEALRLPAVTAPRIAAVVGRPIAAAVLAQLGWQDGEAADLAARRPEEQRVGHGRCPLVAAHAPARPTCVRGI